MIQWGANDTLSQAMNYTFFVQGKRKKMCRTWDSARGNFNKQSRSGPTRGS